MLQFYPQRQTAYLHYALEYSCGHSAYYNQNVEGCHEMGKKALLPKHSTMVVLDPWCMSGHSRQNSDHSINRYCHKHFLSITTIHGYNLIPKNCDTCPVPETYPPLSSFLSPATKHGGVTPKATPYFTPTSIVHWNADVIEESWHMGGGQPKWLSNSIAKLAIYDAWLSDGYITVDISAGKQAKAVSGSVDSDLRKYSPQKTFMVECSSGMKMNQVEEKRLVSETSLTPHLSAGVCSNFIQWAPDESVASFIASDDSVYTWISDGTAPRKVVDHALTVSDWSPDSQKLAIKTSEAATQLGIVNIINRDGKLLNEFQIQSKGEEGLGWLTNDVLMVRYSRYTNWYYAIRTGQFLFSWTSMPTAGLFYQDPQVSPDNRWVFIDQGNEERASTLNPNHYIVRKEYSLFDIQTGKRYVLTDNWSTYLGYAGWNADSTTLYTVSPPVEAGSTAVSNVPYGLLGYDIQTHEYHLLVKDAVQVAWNNDKSRAFVVFATKGKEGQLGLDGGLWKVGTTTLISQWHISDQVVYQDPARDSFFVAFPGLVSIAWSHNNKYVAVSDELGQIKILRNEN